MIQLREGMKQKRKIDTYSDAVQDILYEAGMRRWTISVIKKYKGFSIASELIFVTAKNAGSAINKAENIVQRMDGDWSINAIWYPRENQRNQTTFAKFRNLLRKLLSVL